MDWGRFSNPIKGEAFMTAYMGGEREGDPVSIRLREGMDPLSTVRAMVVNYYGPDAKLTQTGPDAFTVTWTDKRRGPMEDVVEVELS